MTAANLESQPAKRNAPRSYDDYIAILAKSGEYCTDPIGKCLREQSAVAGIPTKDIQYCLRDSDTYAACQRGERLSPKFKPDRAQRGWLIWIETFRPAVEFIRPHEVAVDWTSGIFHQIGTNAYGCISDVRTCLYQQPRREERLQPPPSLAHKAPAPDAEADISAFQAELAKEDPTTREALIQARRGQGRYREQLLMVWNRKCAVSKCGPVTLLRASHIKPWRCCEGHAERLDRYNGLLLSPNLDAAFDNGLISFSDAGEVLISPELSDADAAPLGINASLRLVCVFEQTKPYLSFHRQLHGFDPASYR